MILLKRYLLTVLALIKTSILVAQGVMIGSEFNSTFSDYHSSIVGEDSFHLYAMEYDSYYEKIVLSEFDKQTLNVSLNQVVEVHNTGKHDMRLLKMSFIDNAYAYFYLSFDRSTDVGFKLLVQFIDLYTGLLPPARVLYENEDESFADLDVFDLYISDNKRSAVLHTSSYNNEIDKTKETFVLFDADLDQQLEKEFYLSYKAIEDLVIDDEGSVYFLQNGDIVVLDAQKSYEEWREPIVLEGVESNVHEFIVSMTIDPNQDLVVVGSYVTKSVNNNAFNYRRPGSNYSIEGIFYLRLNGLSKELEASKLNRFNDDYLSQFLTKKNIRKGTTAKVDDDFDRFKFSFDKEGNAIVAAEASYLGVWTVSPAVSVGNTMGSIPMIKGDISVYFFKRDGTLRWAERIPRKQLYEYRYFGLRSENSLYKFSLFNDNRNCYVVYNDNPVNNSLAGKYKKPKTLRRLESSIPVVYQIGLNDEGKKRIPKYDLVKNGMFFRPDVSYQSNYTEPLYYFISGKTTNCLGMLKP